MKFDSALPDLVVLLHYLKKKSGNGGRDDKGGLEKAKHRQDEVLLNSSGSVSKT